MKTWPAPAKLNLFLHITGQRPDGYHELQTLFQFITLADCLRFKVTDQPTITRHAKSIADAIPETADLTVKAAQTLQAKTGCRLGVEIYLDKHIPIGAGLGGGSSDTATTLIALNKLWQTELPLAELLEIGSKLGADVPVFINGQAAWAEGIGDKLFPLMTLDEPWYLIIYPRCQIDSGLIFNTNDLTRNTPRMKMRDSLPTKEIIEHYHNDCTAIVRRLFPEVSKALDWLGQYAEAKLTGTGACVFARFESQQKIATIYEKLPKAWQGFIVKGQNYSPLYVAMQ